MVSVFVIRVLAIVSLLSVICASMPAAGAVSQSSVETNARSLTMDQGTSEVFFQQNNSTVRHQNPNEAESADSTEQLERELAARLSQRLKGSSTNLSQGDYEKARALLGDDYDSLLKKYAAVAEEQGNEQSAEDLREAREQQRSYVQTVSKYQQTLTDYHEAKESGNESRARQQARKLARLSRQTQENASALNQTYETVENQTSANVSDAQQQVVVAEDNVSQAHAEVVAAEFTETTLTVHSTTSNGSFSEPFVLRGQLETQNGTPLERDDIRLQIGSQLHTVNTTATGEFTVTYRPTAVSTNTTVITAQYIPNETSIYLGSNSTFTVSLSQETATVTITNASSQVGFSDEVTVTGYASINGTNVSNLPLVLSLGEVQLGQTVTNANGSFTLSKTIDMAPPAGTAEFSVQTQSSDLAVQANQTGTQVEIVEQTPTLTASVERGVEGRIHLTGQLTGPTGTQVPDQPLQILVNGSSVAEIHTGENGTYNYTLLPATIDENASVVTVRYAGRGTNLAAVDVQGRLSTATQNEASNVLGTVEEHSSVIVVFLGALVSAGGALAYTRTKENDPAEVAVDLPPDTETDSDTVSQPSLPSLDPAREALTQGEYKRSITSAYAVVRTHLTQRSGIDANRTHWQFYQEVHDLDILDGSTFRTLTTAYEQAQYSDGAVSEELAHEAVDVANMITESLSEQPENRS